MPGEPQAAALSPPFCLSALLFLLYRPEWYPDMGWSSWDGEEGRINTQKPILVPERQSRPSQVSAHECLLGPRGGAPIRAHGVHQEACWMRGGMGDEAGQGSQDA